MKLLTLEQAAEQLAISVATLRSWVWHKKIEVVRIGRCVRIRQEALDELVARNTVPPQSKQSTSS